jgi:5-methylcytosine-specific restriction endonuclease McrA
LAYQALSAEQRKARSAGRAEYQRQYKEANQERIKRLNADRYAANRAERSVGARERYLGNRERIIAQVKARYAADPSATAERATKWNKENPGKRKAISRKYDASHPEIRRAACKRFRQKHPEYFKAKMAEWKAQNPTKNREYVANRRARTTGSGGRITARQINDLYGQQNGRCAGCRKNVGEDFHLDHVMPLALGGAHSIENAQILCARCNQSKHAKHPVKWAAEVGRLFA